MRNSFAFLFLIILFHGCRQKPKEPPPVKVEVAQVTSENVQDYIPAIGNIYENAIVEIRPQVQGILLEVYVEQGDFVKKGDLMYLVDPRPYEQLLKEAQATLIKDEANLEIARTTVARFTEAAFKDFIATLQYEEYLANLDMAQALVEFDKASLAIAQINLDYCKIHATIAGKVGAFNLYPGDLVLAGDPNALIEIRDLSSVDIQFSIPQGDLQEVLAHKKIDDLKIELFLPFQGNKKFTSELYFMDNHVDPLSGMLTLKANSENEDLALWPGEYVEVHLLTKILENVTVIPMSALLFGQQGPYVYVVQEDMTVKAVPVEMGPRTEATIVIKQGLKKGDKVVTNGQINLRSGSKIQIVEGPAP